MAEMTESGHYHCHVVFAAEFDGVVIANGAAGLNYGIDSGFVSDFHAVGKGEEGVGGHHATFGVEFKAVGLFNSMTESIHTGSLTNTACNEHLIASKYDCVAL